MQLLKDITTYVRRIIKSPSDAVISDALIIDYINRFFINDVDARMQTFDLKTTYSFETVPGVNKYNMPLYDQQEAPANSGNVIGMYPVYQGFVDPCFINGVRVPLETQKNLFYNTWLNNTQNLNVVATGDGGSSYSFFLPILANTQPVPANPPFQGILRGHVDMAGVIATGNNVDPPLADNATAAASIAAVPVTSVDSAFYITSIDVNGNNVVVADSGQFLSSDVNYGLLMKPGKAPYGNTALNGGYSTTSNTVNYFTGEVNVDFSPVTIPVGVNINVQCNFFTTGLPRSMLYYNNTLTLLSPPAMQYLVQLDAYLTPAAFLNTEKAIPFGYMAEYLARGAARKILSDTGDVEQFNFYEPLFLEQESLVWKRSQRQWTGNRTHTIYSQGYGGNNSNNFNNGYGGGFN